MLPPTQPKPPPPRPPKPPPPPPAPRGRFLENDPPVPPTCPDCQKAMELVRTIPRLGALSETLGLYCAP